MTDLVCQSLRNSIRAMKGNSSKVGAYLAKVVRRSGSTRHGREQDDNAIIRLLACDVPWEGRVSQKTSSGSRVEAAAKVHVKLHSSNKEETSHPTVKTLRSPAPP